LSRKTNRISEPPHWTTQQYWYKTLHSQPQSHFIPTCLWRWNRRYARLPSVLRLPWLAHYGRWNLLRDTRVVHRITQCSLFVY
jgi:hypothetical protein